MVNMMVKEPILGIMEQNMGEWKYGNSDGQGTYTWTTGGKYVGEWKDGKHDGQGTYTSPDGSVQKGLWKNGKFIGK